MLLTPRRRVILSIVLALSGCSTGPGAACPKCSVVLITIDTLRPDHMGIYGHDTGTTPAIDAFFSGGTRFVRASAGAPCTIPSVKQILTGTYDFPDAQPRLAEILREHGYRTAAFVSQHFFRGPGGPLPEFARGFDAFDVQDADAVDQHRLSTRRADEVTDAALAWLDEHAGDTFLLWLHYFDPHDPYEPPEAHRLFSGPDAPRGSGDRRSALMRAAGPGEKWHLAGRVFDARQVAHLRGLYDAEIHYVDAEVGRVLRALDARGLVERSVVALTSDHGERLGELDTWDHCLDLHPLELDVPLLLRVAGGPLAGHEVVGGLASTVDVVPTILQVLGHPPAPGTQGVALPTADDDRHIFAHWARMWSIRNRRWKLDLTWDGALELYDAEADRLQQRNRAEDRPDVLETMVRLLDEQGAPIKRAAAQMEALRERLKALGYTE
jgi:arylsulfatase